MASIETSSPLAQSSPPHTSDKWKLTIKTVGTIQSRSPFSTAATSSFLKSPTEDSSTVSHGLQGSASAAAATNTNSDGESTFDIAIHPNDSLYSLSRQIEHVTGLEVGRQRLIYRGRILVVDFEEEEDITSATATNGVIPALNSEDAEETIGIRGLSDSTCDTDAAITDETTVFHHADLRNNSNNSHSGEDDSHTALPITRQNSSETIHRSSISDYITQLQQRESRMNSNASLITVPPPPEDTKTIGCVKKIKQRICDVKGLKDGHTIHLVPRPAPPSSAAASLGVGTSSTNNSSTATDNNSINITANNTPFASLLNNNNLNNEGGITSISGPDGMNLLAALLGMSNSDEGSGIFLNRDEAAAAARLSRLRRGGGGTSSTTTARARAAAARLTEADVRARDPGSLEPVRQGLMTLHTLLGNALFTSARYSGDGSCSNNGQQEEEGKAEEEEKMGSIHMEEEEPFSTSTTQQQNTIPPSFTIHQLESNRQWYRGQWLDALDTVNQWLEATVVDIVLPSEILTNNSSSCPFEGIMASSPCNDARRLDNNKKLLRRRRRTPDAVVSANDFDGRRRLLLEPRTPHTTDSSTPTLEGMSILIDDGYQPRPDNDGVQLLLIHYNGWPHRWDEWIRSDSERIRPFRTRTRHRATSQLASPTPSNVFQAAPATHILDEDDEIERVSLLPELHRVISSVNEILEGVIPFDGRRVDTTPFAPSEETAYLPWSIPPENGLNESTETPTSPRRRRRLDSVQLRRLAPLMDRLGRTLTDAAPHIACLADSLPSPRVLREDAPLQNNNMAAGSGGMDGWGPSRIGGGTTSDPFAAVTSNRDERLNDPDLTDYINGMVNTSRSVSRSDRERDPLVAGLLSNYLSSQGGLAGAGGSNENNNDEANVMGRLIRMGGTNNAGGRNGDGPGIDIHIHAVVTGPGMNTIEGLGGTGGVATGTTTTPLQSILRNGNSSANRALSGVVRPMTAPALNEEDQGLFSELYSESPTPLNMHGSSNSSIVEAAPQSRDLFEEFTECMSVEDESCESEDVEVTTPDVPALVADAPAALDVSDSADDADEQKPAAKEVSTKTNDGANDSIPAAQAAMPTNEESARQDSNGSINTISEIGSDDSSPPSEPLRTENATSPSFTNRLFRRTLGRFGTSHRRAGGSSP
ncbi:hypothetical protein ACHAXN_011062 [Cyclotella atomus]